MNCEKKGGNVVEIVAPTWMKIVIGIFMSGLVTLFAWLLLSVHTQDGLLKDIRSESVVSNTRLLGRIELLTREIQLMKESTLDRTKDLYSATEARARRTTLEDRHTSYLRRFREIERSIKDYHGDRK